MARGIERARSAYCEEKGVGSEREWREKAREAGIACTCMNIGLPTWAETREALGSIYEDALSRGVRPPDRFNLIAERRMGLPKDKRAEAPQETGPVMMTEQDWWELAHTVPIEPEAADNTIGGPASVENARDALQAGVTSIGVLSQYSWRWPYFDDDVNQTTQVLQAAGMLAAFKDEGVVFDSYLEDGYPGVFHDYANYVGWAMVERYISEELIGAAYSPSWGGLTQNPVIKSAVTLALDAVNFDRVPFLYTQGDTIGNTPDFDANMAVLNTDLLFTKMVDRRYRLGSASIAVPVTETERIPTWQEVATVQTISRRLEDYVPMVEPVVDWAQIEAMRDQLVRGGKAFFDAAIGGLAGAGIDTRDPAQLLLVLKRLGSTRCEELFGAGEARPGVPPRSPAGAGNGPGQQDDGRARAAAGRAAGPARRGGDPGDEGPRHLHRRPRVRRVPAHLDAGGGRHRGDRLRRQPRSRGHRQSGDRDRRRRGRDHHPQRGRPRLRSAPDEGARPRRGPGEWPSSWAAS